ncbi:MAG TPA: 50S ribosomal L9 C-terminal domain-containing protein [Nocardioides sp.]|nr:50S ribosomal L9 C-terminal domain-containing protein [Nocardioides sp.]
MVIASPIKALGNHAVSVKLHDEVSASVALTVVAS